MELYELIKPLPDDEKRKIKKLIDRDLGIKQREKVEIDRNEMIAMAGKMLSLMKDYNTVEMKKTLQFALRAVEGFCEQNKNPGRSRKEKD